MSPPCCTHFGTDKVVVLGWRSNKMKSTYTQKIAEEGLIKYLPNVNMTDRDKEIVKRFLEEDFSYRRLGEAYEISG